MAIDHRLVGPGSTEIPSADYSYAARMPVPNYSIQDMRGKAIDQNIKMKQLEAAQAEADRVNMLRSKLAGLSGEEGFNWDQASNLLAASGDIKSGMDIRKMLSGEATQSLEDEGLKLKNAFDLMTVAGQMAERVGSQQDLENLTVWADKNLGRSAAEWLPKTYTPEAMKEVQKASYAYKDKIANQLEMMGFEVRKRGQDLTYQAAKDRNALGWSRLAHQKEKFQYDQQNPKTGMQISYDAEGRPIITMGGRQRVNPDGTLPAGATDTVPISKSTQTHVQKESFNVQKQLALAENVKAQLNKEFHTWKGKAKMFGYSFATKVKVDALPAHMQEEYREFIRAESSILRLLSERLADMSGAAVTKTEEDRMKGYIPAPGDDWIRADEKINEFLRLERMALYRYHYALRHGIAFKSYKELPLVVGTLDEMPRLIQRRGNELFNELSRDIKEPDRLEQAVIDALELEFGGLQ